jgi:hypothetical protein
VGPPGPLELALSSTGVENFIRVVASCSTPPTASSHLNMEASAHISEGLPLPRSCAAHFT